MRRLMLTAFRNYGAAELELDERPVVLLGPNGAGKTNLLEALSLLTPGRGLRGARLEDLTPRGPRNDTAPWAVAAEVATAQGARSLGTGLDPKQPEAQRRVARLDGEAASSLAALGEVLAAVWLTPQMDRLFQEGASGRRRFLDRLVFGFDAAHAGRIAGYEHAMRERSRLLKQGSRDAAWLAALEESMAERSVAIAAARRQAVTRLSAAVAEGVGPFPRARLGLLGDAEAWLEEFPAVEVEGRIAEGLAASRESDSEGGAARGAHRADLAVADLASGMPAEQCSTGEQKALLICVVLAHARLLAKQRGAPPLLLLDEVAAHLDGRRREALYAELLALGAQAWMSGTEDSFFAPLGGAAQRFAIAGGALRQTT
ncbi:MAG: DNA replication/repair protein RecF [Rhodovibrionaceae bacterium]